MSELIQLGNVGSDANSMVIGCHAPTSLVISPVNFTKLQEINLELLQADRVHSEYRLFYSLDWAVVVEK